MRALWDRAAGNVWARWAPIIALVLVNLVVGFLLVNHYGQSTDEEANILFARATLLSYEHPETPFLDPSREDKGPFYFMVWLKAGEFLGRTVPGWVFTDGRHFVNFLAFQLALVSLYALALRFVRPSMALAGVLLFETQPLFFGHAFINQKDMPFMAFFAAGVVLGIGLVDAFRRGWEKRTSQTGQLHPARPAAGELLIQGWVEARPRARRAAALAACLLLAVPVGRLLLNGPLRASLERVILDAYRGQAWQPINQLFSRVAENAAQVGPEAYILRANRLMDMGTVGASFLMALVAIVVAVRFWPVARRRFWPAVAHEVKEGLVAPIPPLVFAAAVVLGMALAIRSTALFAGLLVVVYALALAGPRMVALLMLYFSAAAFTAYLLWPQLWVSPVGMIAASLDRTMQFPQVHRTLFEGITLLSNAMPRWYLPEVIAIQVTLPALALIVAGLAVVAKLALGRERAILSWVILLWVFVPFLAVVGFRVPVYNYSRHLLFMMPPLFVMAAVALERGRQLIRSRGIGLLLVAAVLLPGLWAIVRLHPYEYGYFNEFVGGVRSAYGRFLPDYWCTSFREAMQYVNANAPPSAGIAVTGPESNAIPFAREDLRVKQDSEMLTDDEFQPVMIMGCAWSTIDPAFFPDAPLVWTVERDGVPLAVVKLLATPQP
ncbi:MAG: hypothetical protein HW376_117 [candidate division NC10 bacterium]|nr:hypothetical protein [candidate division NC10 bacterium]